jgi:hypothetical protein
MNGSDARSEVSERQRVDDATKMRGGDLSNNITHDFILGTGDTKIS